MSDTENPIFDQLFQMFPYLPNGFGEMELKTSAEIALQMREYIDEVTPGVITQFLSQFQYRTIPIDGVTYWELYNNE